MCNTTKKVIPSQERRLRRKALGNGVVVVGQPLKWKNGRGASIRFRCTLECTVNLNRSMIKYQRQAMIVCVGTNPKVS